MTTPTAQSARSPQSLSPATGKARPRRSNASIILRYTMWEFYRSVRLIESSFFIIFLPTALYLMFGAAAEYGDYPSGNGNVAAYVMIAMGLYGAVTATTSLAGAAAVERQRGWGRQLGMTGLSKNGYLIGKVLVGLLMAVLVLIVLNIVGYATGARMDSWQVLFGSALLSLIGALPFCLYGLAAALVFRSEAAVGAASGILVVLAFFGNLFMPLSDTMLDFAHFTPLYGAAVLARWQQLEGEILDGAGQSLGTDPLWLPIVSVIAWTLIFCLVCWVTVRRTTQRS